MERRGARIGCWLTKRDLTALADGELSARRAGRVSAHLQGCDRCASLYAGIEHAAAHQRTLLTEAASTAAQPDVERMLVGLRRRLAESEDSSARRAWRPVGIGAVAVAALAVFVYVRDSGWRPEAKPSTNRSGEISSEDVGRRDTGPVITAPLASAARDQRAKAAETSANKSASVRPPRPEPEGGAAAEVARESEELPEELVARPELFMDYGIVVRLDALANFEKVQKLPRGAGHETQQAG